jgi:hypothetical protein
MKSLRNPISMGQIHASDRRNCPIQQEVAGTAITVIRRTNAAGVGDHHFSSLWVQNAPNVGAMDMTIDGNRFLNATLVTLVACSKKFSATM